MYNQIAEDQKYGEMVVKGVTRFETLDVEVLINFFTYAVSINLRNMIHFLARVLY